MEHRRVDHLAKIRTIQRGPSVRCRCSISDTVWMRKMIVRYRVKPNDKRGNKKAKRSSLNLLLDKRRSVKRDQHTEGLKPLERPAYSTTRWTLPPLVKWGRLPSNIRSAPPNLLELVYSLNPKLSMTTPCPVKLASPCNCTHITLSPNLQSFGEFFKSAYCFARVLPRATELMASNSEHLFQAGIRSFLTGKK